MNLPQPAIDPAVAAAWRPVVQPWHGGTPEDAAAVLRGRPGLAWLDSALPDHARGRWSIVASDPRWTLTARGGAVLLHDATGRHRVLADAPSALAAFARAVEAEPRPEPAAAPAEGEGALPFLGGAIGYLGFELGREVERLPATTRDDVGAPDLAFGWYDAALVWDGARGLGWLAGRAAAVAALRLRLGERLAPVSAEDTPAAEVRAGVLRSNMTPRAYLDAVARARRYIEAGDIYQVNLSQRFSAPTALDGFAVYRRLRAVSPAPFAAYLDQRASGGVQVLSSSPERFLLADGDALETRPIKGTRPRGETPAQDAALAAALRGSVKDRAEHLMIVDLERNDLGRVAVAGSVRVPAFAALESYAQVHHLTSTVTGRRRGGVGLEALLRATFPGGSISGAPKIRALEIIDELEPTVRGVYTGAIGYVSAHGRVDLNIAIRTITLADGVAYVHVGGAIVHDSDAEAEYAETLDKARGMARALGVTLPDEAPVIEGTASLAAASAS
ncbi:MAG: aminodeoxychorismate synthase component I [Dehalococcoidia bacterium]|nr:aminodeoxychorismate synthase component I [Dehalococcoidia bacterium]